MLPNSSHRSPIDIVQDLKQKCQPPFRSIQLQDNEIRILIAGVRTLTVTGNSPMDTATAMVRHLKMLAKLDTSNETERSDGSLLAKSVSKLNINGTISEKTVSKSNGAYQMTNQEMLDKELADCYESGKIFSWFIRVPARIN